MQDSEKLHFIDKIYSTITQPSQWSTVLEEFSNHLSIKGANIFCWDDIHSELSKTWMTSHLSDLFPRFAESGFLQLEANMFPNIPGVLPTHHLFSNDEWARKAVKEKGIDISLKAGNHWLKENGDIHHRYTATMNVLPGYIDFISLHVGNNYLKIKDQLKQDLNPLLPHIQRAIYINRPFSILEAQYNAVLEVLDKFKLGVIICDGKLNILLHNSSAESMLFSEDGLRSSNGQLRFQDSAVSAQVVSSIGKLQDDPSCATTLTLPRASQALPYVCQLSRLDLRQQGEKSPKFLLTMIDPERSDIVNLEGIQHIFNLTPRETEIVRGVVDGLNNQQIADRHNISPETVKTHIKATSQKTHCKSRTEIIKLAHSTSIPIDK